MLKISKHSYVNIYSIYLRDIHYIPNLIDNIEMVVIRVIAHMSIIHREFKKNCPDPP